MLVVFLFFIFRKYIASVDHYLNILRSVSCETHINCSSTMPCWESKSAKKKNTGVHLVTQPE